MRPALALSLHLLRAMVRYPVFTDRKESTKLIFKKKSDFVKDLYVKELRSYKAPPTVRFLLCSLHAMLTHCDSCRLKMPTSVS